MMQPAEKLAKLRQFCTDLFTRYRLSSKGRNGLTEAEDGDEIFFINQNKSHDGSPKITELLPAG